jgi:hypothetical protein
MARDDVPSWIPLSRATAHTLGLEQMAEAMPRRRRRRPLAALARAVATLLRIR